MSEGISTSIALVILVGGFIAIGIGAYGALRLGLEAEDGEGRWIGWMTLVVATLSALILFVAPRVSAASSTVKGIAAVGIIAAAVGGLIMGAAVVGLSLLAATLMFLLIAIWFS